MIYKGLGIIAMGRRSYEWLDHFARYRSKDESESLLDYGKGQMLDETVQYM